MATKTSSPRAQSSAPAPQSETTVSESVASRKKSTSRDESSAAVTAVEMGARQREISVSEFFTKNRHLLGFDNPRKALLTCVKEAVDNSLDACEEAGILPEVTVRLEMVANGQAPVTPSQATRFRITVTDNGPGIDQKYFGKIFEMFQTLARRDELESTGIGLAVVKKIVELHGGTVWIESTVGEGSTFFFTLPKLNVASAQSTRSMNVQN